MDTRHERTLRGSPAGPALRDGDVLARWTTRGRQLRLRALRATLHRELADVFEAAQRAALRRHGLERSVVTRAQLRSLENTWLLVVDRPDDADVLAGARVDLYDPARPLQVEQIVGRFGAEPLDRLRDRLHAAVAEFCGMWVRDDHRKQGFPERLSAAAVAAATRLGLTRLVGIAPPHTMGAFTAVGFRIVRELGDEGAYPYPDERFRSWIIDVELPRSRVSAVTRRA